jgi:integrase
MSVACRTCSTVHACADRYCSFGFRQSELLGLVWEDADFEERVIHVRYQLGRKPRVRLALKADNKDGLPKLSFHDLRHTAITHLIRSGVDVAQVQRFAGHAKPSITLDLYVGEFENRKVNDSGARRAAIYESAL